MRDVCSQDLCFGGHIEDDAGPTPPVQKPASLPCSQWQYGLRSRMRNRLSSDWCLLREVGRPFGGFSSGLARALRSNQHWESRKSGTDRRPQRASNLRKQLRKTTTLHLSHFGLGAGSFFKGSLPSLGAMSSSQSLRRLVANRAVPRPASLLRSAPTTSRCLLRSSVGVRSLSTRYNQSYSQVSAQKPRYIYSYASLRGKGLTIGQETFVHYTITPIQSLKSLQWSVNHPSIHLLLETNNFEQRSKSSRRRKWPNQSPKELSRAGR